ncbi:indolepyruvate decarboxylase [Chimaeribacter arupi]|uniref:alpha-keto acid decarboxylase family protein n=1 Tax=Yersiniaceae TaxID=1903411 RepID=UPI000934B5E0|nr:MULTISPECIES: thiamine pyrophosphate-binding protein [Yersiniaceae]MDV5140401.1 thiamine pyrophosphate-binding protein [Chimaeribacter arupi]PLR38865.1 indolepyruvate decarboxylase [Chimaeribacter arupi]PLR50037.1 indolepyruvate decarboxylase [Chimaeribacter arupi]PLR50505.1 indolepyruvate decarboxylase [Chimaeribacter arupi]WKZ93382.1 thiamine pyrophosphate-binding protein [Chimaeribacter arupi]
MSEKVTVGDYLLARLAEVGIEHLFGVPGDYNLQFLDHVIDNPGITWVGCANELNAAYAADGYARCRGAGALLTTFGVGELSAINGTAGSYAEYVPVVHVVGAPPLASQQRGEWLHHSLGDGDFGHFARMAQEVTVAQARLTVDNAQAEIDRVITTVLHTRRPGYLLLPSDVAAAPLPALPLPLVRRKEECSPEALAAFTAAADALLSRAGGAAVLADFLADRFGVGDALNRWLAECGLPHSTLLLGKSVLNEQNPAFTGTYAGAASDEQVRHTLEGADVMITVGVKFTDTITAGFSQQLPPEKTIDLQPFQARVGAQVFNQLPMAEALTALQQVVARHLPRWQGNPVTRPALPPAESGRLDQPAFWQAMQAFLRPGDILVAEQGTACFGAAALTLPEGCRMLVQPLWGSIGYTLPAAFGAQIARPDRRVVLLIGDGSAQLTAQELGSMIRDGLNPVIIILNNQGYTVERAIHGARQRYNDIAQWDWTHLPRALGSRDGQVVALQAADTAQLHDALAQVAIAEQLALIEVILPKMDVPELLQAVTQALEQRNAGKTPAAE